MPLLWIRQYRVYDSYGGLAGGPGSCPPSSRMRSGTHRGLRRREGEGGARVIYLPIIGKDYDREGEMLAVRVWVAAQD